MKKKRIAAFACATVVCFSAVSGYAASFSEKVSNVSALTTISVKGETYNVTSNKEISVFLDRSEVAFDSVKPMIINDRTMVPIRFLGSAIGIKENDISYDEATETVVLKYNNKKVTLVVGDKNALVDIDKVELDVPVIEVDGRVLVPFRFVCETFGYSIDYGETDTKMNIFMKKTNGVTKQ